MPRNYKKRQLPITFVTLMKTVSEEFQRLTDHRRANACYDIAYTLRIAFARLSLKSPSLPSFRQQILAERQMNAFSHLSR